MAMARATGREGEKWGKTTDTVQKILPEGWNVIVARNRTPSSRNPEEGHRVTTAWGGGCTSCASEGN